MSRLLSQNPSKREQGQPFTYKGVQYGPEGLGNNQWRVDRAGMEYLADTERLWSNVEEGVTEASANQLHLKIYRSEMPGRRINNNWNRIIAPSDKRYAVQTGDLTIARCMLMTTEPGDLVLDPTGGAGTTALVAERWGRRWISIDSSRDSIAIARERVLVHDYPNHFLIGSEEGFQKEQELRKEAGQELLAEKPKGEQDPRTGLVIERMPYVSAATLAYKERPDKQGGRDITWFVDRPKGRQRGRVCSRFTVETELMDIYRRPDEMIRPTQARRDANWQERIIRHLDDVGVRSDGGEQWNVEGVDSIIDEASNGQNPGALSHTCVLIDKNSGKKTPAVIAIWPEDAKVDVAALQRNVQAVVGRGKKEVLIVVGAEFADGTESGGKKKRWAAEVMRVKAGTDLHLTGVKDTAGASNLVLVAEPAVKIESAENDQFVCTVMGWNEFNPITGMARWKEQKDIQMWMLDTNYDQTQFCARRIHLPRRLRQKKNRQILEGLIGQEGSPDAIKAVFGWTSQPFPKPSTGEIAIRVITTGGGMMSWSGSVDEK